MRFTPRPVNLTLPAPLVPRSKGTHVSGIIRNIALEMGVLKSDGVDEPTMADIRVITDPTAIMRILIGLAWEEFYLPQIPNVKKHPGEMCVDGVYMTPDGIENGRAPLGCSGPLGRSPSIIHEVKATYKSLKTASDLNSQWLWMTQISAYCKGYGTRFARLHVLFLNGDYKYPLQPQVKAWDIEFEQAEIDRNWDMLREYRDYREAL
jgi:hypothetical protein